MWETLKKQLPGVLIALLVIGGASFLPWFSLHRTLVMNEAEQGRRQEAAERWLQEEAITRLSRDENNRRELETIRRRLEDFIRLREADAFRTEEEPRRLQPAEIEALAETLAKRMQPLPPLPKSPEEWEKTQAEQVRKVAEQLAEKLRTLAAQSALKWPPPRPSTFARLDRGYGVCAGTYADAAARLEAALSKAGYSEKAYHALPVGGFVLICRLEQIRVDGTPVPEPDRWSAAVPAMKEFSIAEYVRRLFTARPGRYRVIMFAVTADEFHFTDDLLTAQAAKDLLTGGFVRLPAEIGLQPVPARTDCYALVYEFEKPTANDPAQFIDASPAAALQQLERTRILAALSPSPP